MDFKEKVLWVNITVGTGLHHLKNQGIYVKRLTNELKSSRGSTQPFDKTVRAQ